MINGRQCKILKHDGCNKNIISTDFVIRNRKYLKILDKNLQINHSSEGFTERTLGIVINVEVQIGKHTYRSSWARSNCKYDVILGIQWHEENQVVSDYSTRTLTGNGRFLPVPKSLNNGLKVCNLVVKKFRSLLRKKSHKRNFEVYHVMEINISCETKRLDIESLSPEIFKSRNEIIQRYSTVFRDDLPAGLPPERAIDDEIRTEE